MFLLLWGVLDALLALLLEEDEVPLVLGGIQPVPDSILSPSLTAVESSVLGGGTLLTEGGGPEVE